MAALHNRAQSVVVVVLLYIRPGKGAAFRRYEDRATALIAEYGGSVNR